MALLGFKVNVGGRGQTAKNKVKGRNAVGGTSIANRRQFYSTSLHCPDNCVNKIITHAIAACYVSNRYILQRTGHVTMQYALFVCRPDQTTDHQRQCRRVLDWRQDDVGYQMAACQGCSEPARCPSRQWP